jgi:uncharacterized protein
MITDPWFYALAIPALLATGISKGGFAGGIGLIAVPLMALTISPVQAAGIMLPILIAMDMIGVWAWRKSIDKRNLLYLLPGAALGIGIGALTAGFVEDDHVRLLVGTIAILFVGNHFFGLANEGPAHGPDKIRGTLWGALGGFTSFVAHAGSPPYQIYMLPQKPDKSIYVGTSVMFFTIINLIKLPAYGILGQLAPGNLMTAMVLLPLAPLGMVLGIKLHHKIPEGPFFKVTYALIFFVGLKLIYDGLTFIF